jgi:hypothetical protein
MPERSSMAGNGAQSNRGVSNVSLAGGNRSGMGSGASRFGNAGLFARSNVGAGGLGNSSTAGFGRGNSFAGNSFNGGGSRFGNGGGFNNAGSNHAGLGRGWNGGYGRGGYGGHYGYGRYGYGHYGYGRGWGYGHGWGYGRGWGYGWGPGWGWGGGDGWWLLDDLFGLALNATSLALNPWSPFATLGADLVGDGVQALGNLDNNNNNYGGNYGNGDDQGSYGVYSNDSGYYDNSNYTYPPYRQPYQPLCGTDFSAENPGCVQ